MQNRPSKAGRLTQKTDRHSHHRITQPARGAVEQKGTGWANVAGWVGKLLGGAGVRESGGGRGPGGGVFCGGCGGGGGKSGAGGKRGGGGGRGGRGRNWRCWIWPA